MTNQIDHVVIGCASLDEGAEWLKARTGVDIPRGGKHDTMGTHNCVTQTGNDSFLELLANDPDAPEPTRARWFSMGDPDTVRRLAQRPQALCWVVRTDDLDAVVAASPVDLGEVVTFRRGERSWRLTVPKDGHLPEGGLLPAFIEWSPGPHPSTGQADLGLRLEGVTITHPDPERVRSLLRQLDVDHLATCTEGQFGLSFALTTAEGSATLD